MHVCNVAAEWRATFHKDVVIDLVGKCISIALCDIFDLLLNVLIGLLSP